MVGNYLKVAFRNLLKHKSYTFINILGLALGMTCATLLLLWIQDELSYNMFHKNIAQLYRLELEHKFSEGIYHAIQSPCPAGPVLKSDIPEVLNTARYSFLNTLLLRSGDNAFYESGVYAVDSSFLQLFTFPLVRGNAETALNQPYSILLTEEMARKYFGDDDPVGKTVILNNRYPCTVTGVLAKIPDNSSLTFDVLVPFHFVSDLGRYDENWRSNSVHTFAQLREGTNLAAVNSKITELAYQHSQDGRRYYKPEYMLMPVSDIRLYMRSGFGQLVGTIQQVYTFSGIAIFLLCIACINFMNLATARSAGRAKEVGLRKVVGAMKRHLIGQFYGEALFITSLAFLFSVLLVLGLLPLFNGLSGKKISFHALFQIKFLCGCLGVGLFTGLLSGSYPALFLSSFGPIEALRGKFRTGMKSGMLRKVLVIFQFTLSVVLLAGTVVIYQQVHFMREKKIGYDKEQLLYIPLRGETRELYSLLKAEVSRSSFITSMSGSAHGPVQIRNNSLNVDWDGKDPNLNVLIGSEIVDYDYIETMKIPILEGRSFSREFGTDSLGAFLVNEEVVKLMGVQSAVGKRFKFQGIDGTIIGVMKNFHFLPVHIAIQPLCIRLTGRIWYAIVRLQQGNIQAGIKEIESVWQRLFPMYPFEYRFADEDFGRMYEGDERIGTIVTCIALFAILVACLGLFGLASFMIEQRTKEVGIRKTLGATIPGIIGLLSKEFVRLVLIANLIAWPLAYFLMHRWLADYAYRVTVSWWIFLAVGSVTLMITFLTVSYQSIRAARSNTVDSLRYE